MMRKFIGVFVILFTLGLFLAPVTVSAAEEIGIEQTDALTRVSDGQPVGTNVDNSYAYDVYEYRTDLHDSRTQNTFLMVIGAALVVGCGGMLISHARNRDERAFRKEELAIRREQGQNTSHSPSGYSTARGMTNGNNNAYVNSNVGSNTGMNSAAHSVMQQQNMANSVNQDTIYNHTDLDLHNFG